MNKFWLCVVVSSLLEFVADVCYKEWALGRTALIWAGTLLYVLSSVFWAISLKHETLSKGIVIFSVVNVVMVILTGALLYGEQLTWQHKAGIALGLASIILIES
jgi:drug/metabolite transporter (DMT)-like permease